MIWNGVHFDLNTVIPYWAMIAYAAVAAGVLSYAGRKGITSSFSTIDFVYMGLLAALLIIWNFFVNPLIPQVSSITSWFYYPDIGEVLIIMLVAALIGKPGSVTFTVAIYDVLSDVFHYGFGGEPFWLVQQVLGKAVLIDLYLLLRGKTFGTNLISKPKQASQGLATRTLPGLMFLDGAIVGIVIAVEDPLFYRGFFATFVEGMIYSTHYVIFTASLAAVAGIVMGLVDAPIAAYIKRTLTR